MSQPQVVSDQLARVNLLLVNDRPAQLTAWQAILNDLGQNLVIARSGIEALDHLLTTDFACILLDIHMPGMDGFETAEYIRQRPRSEHVPILFVTAINTHEADRARGYALGAVDYIFTPVVPEILRAKVGVFVELHRKNQQVAQQAAELASLNERLAVQLEEIGKLNAELTGANRVLRAESAERRRAEQRLRRAHDRLELRVQRRTAELAEANAELVREIGERQHAAQRAERNAEQAARERERIARLQAATAALSQALLPEHVVQAVVEQTLLAFNPAALAVLLADGPMLRLAQSFGYAPAAQAALSALPLDANQPAAQAARSRGAVWISSQAAFARHYGAQASGRAECGLEACVAVPLMLDNEALGCLLLEYSDARAESVDDLEMLLTLGRLGAGALERARLYAAAQSARVELEARVAARTAELTAANAELQQSREELRRLSRHLQALREEERARIAREVHDDLGGALTGLKMDLKRIERSTDPRQEKLLAQLRELSASVDSVVSSVRRIATELRPALLDDFGLPAAIEWQLQEFEQRSGIRGNLQLAVSDLPLAPDAATALFRVFQEALTNVARHAQASQVYVSLQEEDGCAVLDIRDDGRGFQLSELLQGRSLGLIGMRERVQLLAGHLDIIGEPGHGTRVLVRVPISGNGQAR
jgi:signal transduction histidine kinase/DNA-binding response OmpR family regulator